MIVTGLPETSLAATWGSEPMVFAPPFGARQGTRLKISPADFATSLTLSIALPARPFCCEGFAESTDATLPGATVPAELSDGAAWAVSARAGFKAPGAS